MIKGALYDKAGYRRRQEVYAELSRTLSIAPQVENTFNYCLTELWQEFDGTNIHVHQLYRSFSDAALLKILIDVADNLDRSSKQSEIYCVYRQYIRLRFGNWPRALETAGLRTPKSQRIRQTG